MLVYKTIPVFSAAAGILLFFAGLLIKRYPAGYRFFNKKDKGFLENLSELPPFKQLIALMSCGRMRDFYQRFIYRHFLNINVNQLILIKLLCVICAAFVAVSVRYTNNIAIKDGIIANINNGLSFSLFQKTPDIRTVRQNQLFYNRVFDEIKSKQLGKVDSPEKIKELKYILSRIMGELDKEKIDSKAAEVLYTIKKLQNIRTIDWLTVLFILACFWIPEILVLIRKLLYSSTFTKEIIKLENVFEMLGSIGHLKTINILDQLAELSRVYKVPMEKLRDTYRVDREAAFQAAAEANNHIPLFRKFAESIRIYSCVDKQLAVQIIERNIKQREEERYLMSEEDADMVEIAAFISIVPIVWQLMDLMLRPMADFIINSFSLI